MDERDELSRVGRRFGLDETEFADELQERDWTPVQVEGRLSILLDLADRWKKEAETVDPPLSGDVSTARQRVAGGAAPDAVQLSDRARR